MGGVEVGVGVGAGVGVGMGVGVGAEMGGKGRARAGAHHQGSAWSILWTAPWAAFISASAALGSSAVGLSPVTGGQGRAQPVSALRPLGTPARQCALGADRRHICIRTSAACL